MMSVYEKTILRSEVCEQAAARCAQTGSRDMASLWQHHADWLKARASAMTVGTGQQAYTSHVARAEVRAWADLLPHLPFPWAPLSVSARTMAVVGGLS